MPTANAEIKWVSRGYVEGEMARIIDITKPVSDG